MADKKMIVLNKISDGLSLLNKRRLLYVFTTLSTVYGFWLVFNMDPYLPWGVRVYNGIKLTLLGHLGIWLATVNIQGKLRFVVAATLLLSAVPLFLLWWNLHLVVAIACEVYLFWVVFRTITGSRFGN